jgi:chromosome segregation ATPase
VEVNKLKAELAEAQQKGAQTEGAQHDTSGAQPEGAQHDTSTAGAPPPGNDSDEVRDLKARLQQAQADLARAEQAKTSAEESTPQSVEERLAQLSQELDNAKIQAREAAELAGQEKTRHADALRQLTEERDAAKEKVAELERELRAKGTESSSGSTGTDQPMTPEETALKDKIEALEEKREGLLETIRDLEEKAVASRLKWKETKDAYERYQWSYAANLNNGGKIPGPNDPLLSQETRFDAWNNREVTIRRVSRDQYPMGANVAWNKMLRIQKVDDQLWKDLKTLKDKTPTELGLSAVAGQPELKK